MPPPLRRTTVPHLPTPPLVITLWYVNLLPHFNLKRKCLFWVFPTLDSSHTNYPRVKQMTVLTLYLERLINTLLKICNLLKRRHFCKSAHFDAYHSGLAHAHSHRALGRPGIGAQTAASITEWFKSYIDTRFLHGNELSWQIIFIQTKDNFWKKKAIVSEQSWQSSCIHQIVSISSKSQFFTWASPGKSLP